MIGKATLLGSVALLSVQAHAQSLAGPKPAAVQTGADAGCIGELSMSNEPGPPQVADGAMAGQVWSIQTLYPTPAVCSFPSARPVKVECSRNGVAVDPIYCQDKQFQSLMAQGYRTVGNSTNWSTAQWVLPGQTDSGCVGRWDVVDGAVPQGCGEVPVEVASTCTVTNVQSGSPTDPEKYCTSPRPAAVKKVMDYRACGFAIETGQWGDYSGTCSTVTHDRVLSCRRQDGTAMDMSDPSCQTALGAYCSTHRCVSVGGSVLEREVVQLQSCPSSDPNGDYFWQTGGWMTGGVTCGSDVQSRSVTCVKRSDNLVVDDSLCTAQRPASMQSILVTAGCSSSSICTGQTRISSWTDASASTDHGSECGTAGGDCVERTLGLSQAADGSTTQTFLSSCYSGGGTSPIAKVGPGEGPYQVHGLTVTSGTDGYCDYSAAASGSRTCLAGAYPVAACTSGVPNVTLSIPGRVRSGQGSVSSTTSFANADGSNPIEGQECRASSTVTNNGETKTLTALGTFGSSSCLGSTSDVVGGTSYTVKVDVQVTPGATGYELQGVATVTGVGCDAPAPAPSPTPTPPPTLQCTAGSYCLLTSQGTYSNCYGDPNYVVDEYVPGGYVGVTFPLDVQAHSIADPDKAVYGVQAVSKARVECTTKGAPTPTPTPTPTPEPTPTPTSIENSQVMLGYCRYTSSGGGRHACGDWGPNYKVGGKSVPGPREFCTGNKIAGYYPGDETPSPMADPLGMEWNTVKAGYHWSATPILRDVPGAKCVIHYKAGYSGEWSRDQPVWVSGYFDGPPSGLQGQTWITK